MNTVITNETNIGKMAYPFLTQFPQWQIEASPLKTEDDVASLAEDEREPTLMWVGDGKANRLFIPHCTAEDFWAQTGLRPSMAKGGFTLSKRLKRVLSPERFWAFLPQETVKITHDESLDAALWDGCGQLSSAFVERFVQSLCLTQQEENELLACNRFEITVMHEGGQEKGHVIVQEGLAEDFVFPADSFKSELRLTGDAVYVALKPIHHHNSMLLDIQSLINLHPFFSNGKLLAWHREWLQTIVAGIQEGRHTPTLMKRLAHIESEDAFEKAHSWHVIEYLASGGHPMWFAGIVKALGNQAVTMLGHKLEKFRFPIPGGRYYIMPAAVGNVDVPQGHIHLDPRYATAWVNDVDWLDYIVAVLGGCDGDDALWIHPFTDTVDGEKKVLVWRSPNQLGEYVLLKPTPASHAIGWETATGEVQVWGAGSSATLPPRIDEIEVNYGQLAVEAGTPELDYDIEAMWPSVLQGVTNANVLGGFCNLLMVVKAVYGRLPKQMPASMEAVIDGMVKEGRDLAPVKAWLEQSALVMAQAQTAVPMTLLNRLRPLLGSDQSARGMLRTAQNHWLDVLVKAAEIQVESFQGEIDSLAFQACPPVGLFHAYGEWIPVGKRVKIAYTTVIRRALQETGTLTDAGYAEAAMATEAVLAQVEVADRWKALIGAALYCYSIGFNKETQPYAGDQVLWQLGAREGETAVRDAGLAHAFLNALRETGLLATPLWQDEGVYIQAKEAPLTNKGIVVRLNGVWLNFLNTCQQAKGLPSFERMGAVDPALRQTMKQKVRHLANARFCGMGLSVVAEAGNRGGRLVAYTERGNPFGMVAPWYPITPGTYNLMWATADDGNVFGLLQAVV